ncbi:hypothetical protein IEQ34_006067 [Dendrobium chrysotoxum]|uniref:Scarecrow-like protein 28 n=1 Tax=Dendrobium chrysotoxum TaxID=161865 RepID=A0AAV7HDY4_DENCH|nr:hypothetical protein IEQ34_006067 [Dendrobium chrysotoxum]
MGTQRLDLPCSFTRKEAAMVSLSLERPAESRGSCSFRPRPVTISSSAIIAQTASWESRREIGRELWNRKRSFKKFHQCGLFEDPDIDRAKKKRTNSSGEGDYNDEKKPSFLAGQFQAGTSGCPNIKSGSSTSGCPNIKSGSSSSSDTHGLSPKLSEDSSHNEEENPSGEVSGFESAVKKTKTEHEGLELLSFLIECAQAISSSNHTAANFYLARLGDMSSPTGTSIQRLVAYFTEALAFRAAKKWQHIFSIAPPRELTEMNDHDEAMALRILNNVTPIIRFIHFTLNERLLTAFEGKDRIHIIDFDIKQGLQWPSLLHSLASMPNPPTHVRVTGIGESKQELQDTGTRLAGLAQALKLPFEFHSVVDRIEDVRLWMLHVKENECVAVNCVLQLHRALYATNHIVLMAMLGLIRSTNPSIVLMAETEAEHNELRWEKRFANALKYYSAVFDLLDYSFTGDSASRIKIEEMFARKIRNLVAYEGVERIERHERFDMWRGMMEDGGFRCVGFNEREIIQSKLLLKMYNCENYSVDKEGGDGFGLTLKWMDQSLYTVSAWAPMEIVGTSSALQPG